MGNFIPTLIFQLVVLTSVATTGVGKSGLTQAVESVSVWVGRALGKGGGSVL